MTHILYAFIGIMEIDQLADKGAATVLKTKIPSLKITLSDFLCILYLTRVLNKFKQINKANLITDKCNPTYLHKDLCLIHILLWQVLLESLQQDGIYIESGTESSQTVGSRLLAHP